MADSGRIVCGALTVDLESRQAWLHGEELGLTSTEFLLLKAFATNPGKVFTRDELLDKVWGAEFDGSPRAIDAHIKNLRKKLSAVILSVEFIQSIRGMGYKFVPPPATPQEKSATPAANIPIALTSFVGRTRERKEIGEALEQTRLLTLTGPAGSGKTRLALEAARERIAKHADGVRLVELAALTNANLVASTAAKALKLSEEPSKPAEETLLDHLRARNALLVLDNCEHLIDACARLIETLLEGCPDLRVLATSREPLKIPGERTYGVPPMSAQSGAALFIDRARSVSPSFAATQENEAAVAAICSQLDGMPLAIELAAGRTRVMPVEQIAARLTHRLALLSGGSRTALPRHQTLQAAIDWSHELLTAEEAALFARLAVFRGGFALDAAERVCSGGGVNEAQIIDLLTRLVEKSLVSASEGPGEARFALLQVIREYAEEKLRGAGELDALARRHAGYYLDMAEEVEKALEKDIDSNQLDLLETELDNFRAALRRSLDAPGGKESETALRLAGALGDFWKFRAHYTEGRKWLEESIGSTSAVEERFKPKAMLSLAELDYLQGDFASALASSRACMEISKNCGDRLNQSRSLNLLGEVAYRQADYAAARAYYDQALEILREIGDEHGSAASLHNLALVYKEQGDYASARRLLEESLSIRRKLGMWEGIGHALMGLGLTAGEQGDFDGARRYYGESLEITKRLGDIVTSSYTLSNLAELAIYRKDLDEAERLLEESEKLAGNAGSKYALLYTHLYSARARLARGANEQARAGYLRCLSLCVELGLKQELSSILEGMGWLSFSEGNANLSARLLGAAEEVRRSIGIPLSKPEKPDHELVMEGLRAKLGDAALQTALAQGAGLSQDQLIRLMKSGEARRQSSIM